MYNPLLVGFDNVRKINDEKFMVICPYHNDHNPSALFNAKQGSLYCFACHTYKSKKQLEEDMPGQWVNDLTLSVPQRNINNDECRLLKRNPLALNNKYLQKRLVTNEQVKQFNILHNRDGIVFPLNDKTGKLTAILHRQYDNEVRYIKYGDMPLIWPYSHLTKRNPVYIVEGVFGVLRADLAGLKAVCSFGTGNTRKIADLIRSTTYEHYTVMDNDLAGDLATNHYIDHGIPQIYHKKDADEMSIEEWLDLDIDFSTLQKRIIRNEKME